MEHKIVGNEDIVVEKGAVTVEGLVFEDSRRKTKLIINTTDKTFNFIANGKEFGFKKADSMRGINFPKEMIIINHKDEDIRLTATAITGNTDFCSAHARDIKKRKSYILIDKIGKE